MTATSRAPARSPRWLVGVGVGVLVLTGTCSTCAWLKFAWLTEPWDFESHDTFTDGLVIPPGYPMREPLASLPQAALDDPLGDAFLAAGRGPERGDPHVDVDLSVLDGLDARAAARTRERLGSDPRWHVGLDGRAFAYRRFANDFGAVQDSLNGFYTRRDPQRQYRVVLGFGGTVYADRFSDESTTAQASADRVTVTTSVSGNAGMRTSHLVVTSAHVVVEIFEEGPTDDRPMTRAAIELVRRTFEEPASLAAARGGTPSLDLANGMQGGIYQLGARIDPGEPGHVHVRAFEAIRELPLSASRMRHRTRQLIGHARPGELSTYTTELRIYEGDWGDHYPARIEVWFEPSDGGPQRKLIEDTFRVEGWMR